MGVLVCVCVSEPPGLALGGDSSNWQADIWRQNCVQEQSAIRNKRRKKREDSREKRKTGDRSLMTADRSERREKRERRDAKKKATSQQQSNIRANSKPEQSTSKVAAEFKAKP